MTEYRVTSVSLTMTLADSTTLNIGDSDIILGSLSVSEASSGSTEFSIGTAIAKRLSFQLKNFNDEYSAYDFNDAQIVATITADADSTVDEANGIVSGFGGTMGSDSVVTLTGASMDDNGIVTMSGSSTTDNYTLGVFYVVDKPNYNGGTITFNALDGLYKTDRDYTTALTFPATLLQIYNELCTNCGIVPAQATIPNANYSVPVKPNLDATTAADMLCYIAQVSGTFAQMNSQGRLELKRYGGTSHSLSETFSMEVDTDDVVITGVKVTECFDETDTLKRQTVLNGTAAYALTIAENPLIGSGKAQAVADFLTSVYVGMQFRPLRITVPTNPEVHVGDGIVFTDYKGNTYSTYATEVDFSTNAPTTIAMNAASPERNSAVRYSAEAKALAESKRLVENEKTARELAIDQIAQQIAGAGGMYETTVAQTGGGNIYYLHNKPTLAESTTILRIDDTGIYISNDGGQTYPIGLDYSGTEILDKIYAIGIDADYITTGLIQSRVSGFSLNMDTGVANLSNVTINAPARILESYPIEVWNTTNNPAANTSADNYSRIFPGSYRTITNTYALSDNTRSSFPTSVYEGYFGGYYVRLNWYGGDGTARPTPTEQVTIFPNSISFYDGSTLGTAARLDNNDGLGELILHNSGSDFITLKGNGTIGRGAIYNPATTATLLDSIGNTELPGRLLSNGGVICSGELAGTSGSAGYVGIAQITIKTSYRNKPLLFIIGNRGTNPTLVSVRFLNSSSSDPGIASIRKFGPATVKIRKTDPSTWVLYVKKSEAWDGINVLYYSNPYNNSTELSVEIMNLFMSDLPSDVTEATDRWEGKVDTAETASSATTATTATMLDTTNANGYTTDEWGNFNHSSTNTTNYWHINKNDGSAVFSVYYETGVVNAIGDYRKNGTSIVPAGTNGQDSGYIRFPNVGIQIAWQRKQINSQYVNNAWSSLYESAKLSFNNWAANFSVVPTTAYYISNTTSNFGCMIECFAMGSTTNPGAIYAVRPNSSGSQNLVITAIGIGKYT